jgi:hypothetical protein
VILSLWRRGHFHYHGAPLNTAVRVLAALTPPDNASVLPVPANRHEMWRYQIRLIQKSPKGTREIEIEMENRHVIANIIGGRARGVHIQHSARHD